MFTTACRNLMLDANGTTHVSAHSAYSASGANEISGGSPAYARKAISYGAAASEAKSASTSPVFDIPAAATVRFIGRWTAITARTFLGMEALGGSENEFSVDLTANTVKVPAHGYAANDKIVFYGGTVPTGLTEGTVYFAVTVTTDTFQVSATSGGAAIDLTGEPGRSCVVSKITEEAFGSQGTLTVSANTLRLDA